MPVSLWSSPAFVDEARAWVAARCEALGITVTGEWEQPHVRPWSSAIRFESDDGRLWFKVNGPATAFEARLTCVLGRLRPDLVPEVLAIDDRRAWSLTRDGGPVLRSVLEPEALWDVWPALLQRYAEAQLELARHRAQVLATGVEVLTPATLPDRARELLDDLSRTPVAEGGLTDEEAKRLAHRLVDYEAWCAELAGSPVPDSVQHDDLHSSNVCWNGSAAGARIIDWGDASWGHPFGTMLCTLNSIAFHADTEVDDPRVRRMRDAYLESFGDRAGRHELVRYVELARRTGCVTRALAYRSALVGAPVSVHVEYDWPVRGWLLDLLEDWTGH